MKFLFLSAALLVTFAAFAQTDYYNSQQDENNRDAEAQRNPDVHNGRNRTPNATGGTGYS